MTKRKIIVAVLNWGLGHASRSIPLITALQKEGFAPILASDGDSLLLLRKEFPDLQWLELPSYRISYPGQGRSMRMHFLLKAPQILKAVAKEYRLLKRFIASEGEIAGIISDNRFGCFSRKIPSVYITHQLRVLSGTTSFLTTRVHQLIINRFTECWIPDGEGPGKLSGKMSAGQGLKLPLKYIGPQSRFRKKVGEGQWDLLVLLSGPEPQRSLLEEILLRELKGYDGKILFIRGKIASAKTREQSGNMSILNFLTGKELEAALNSADLVIARPGYSTVMDLAALGKKAFFIPTPGQYEQEYLAERLQGLNIAPYCSQDRFSLKELEKTRTCSGFTAIPPGDLPPGLFALFQGK